MRIPAYEQADSKTVLMNSTLCLMLITEREKLVMNYSTNSRNFFKIREAQLTILLPTKM